MILKHLVFFNLYIVLTCIVLIALPIFILFSNSEIPSKSSERVQNIYVSDKESENDHSLPVAMPSYNHTLFLNKNSNLDNFNDSLKSKRNPINQTTALNANLRNIDEQQERNSSDVLLYRKRRYLLFPEGSSFQLVYDLIIPIVDYTNYAIMGITCAVAWELPSKPPSEIENDLVDKLNDGTFGLSRNDSIDDIKYVDTPQKQKPMNDHLSKIIYIQPSEYTYQSSPGKTVLYSQPQKYTKDRKEYGSYKKYIPRPVYTGNQEKKPIYYATTYNSPFKLKSINNERIDTETSSNALWKSHYAKKPAAKKLNNQNLETRPSGLRQHFPRSKQHAVYHIMGKRSAKKKSEMENIHPLLEKLDRIHLKYHRSSRHALYSKIEVMFNKYGKNGTECVLRALCETGERRHETEPGGLLVEILRAIFTMPEADDEIRKKELHPKRNAWDEAHWNSRNCSETYPLCEDFIWNSKYIY